MRLTSFWFKDGYRIRADREIVNDSMIETSRRASRADVLSSDGECGSQLGIPCHEVDFRSLGHAQRICSERVDILNSRGSYGSGEIRELSTHGFTGT